MKKAISLSELRGHLQLVENKIIQIKAIGCFQ